MKMVQDKQDKQDKQFKCPYPDCDYETETQRGLSMHITKVHDGKPNDGNENDEEESNNSDDIDIQDLRNDGTGKNIVTPLQDYECEINKNTIKLVKGVPCILSNYQYRVLDNAPERLITDLKMSV